MPTQLRVYTINRGALRQFAEEWKKTVYPLRIEHGYHIDGAWVLKASNQFVWLLRYDGPDSWDDKEKAYYDSTERRRMDPDPARLIARPEHYFVEQVV